MGAHSAGDPVIVWGRVTIRSDRVLIVAAGPSAERLDLELVERAAEAGCYVLAVKSAIDWLPVVHGWATVDMNRRSRAMIETRRDEVEYYAVAPRDFGSRKAANPIHRLQPPPGLTYLEKGGVIEGLSEDPAVIRSGNSAFGALGIVYHMRPRRIAIVGLDGTPAGYARTQGCPRGSLDHLPGLFASAVPQLQAAGTQVVNGSPRSAVTCWPRCSPNHAVRWLINGRMPKPMLKLLVLGGAANVWDDAKAALAMAEFDAVLACKDMIADWPGMLDYGVSLHQDRNAGYLKARAEKGYPGRPQIWSHRAGGTRGYADKSVTDWGGASGLFGVRVGIEEGFQRIVLAGVPMTPDAGHYKRGKPWREAERYRSAWNERADDLRQTVRSMSGYTAALLGTPTTDWLDG